MNTHKNFLLSAVLIRQAMETDISMMQKFIFEHGKNEWNYLPEDKVKAHLAEMGSEKVHGFIADLAGECLGFVSFYYGVPNDYDRYETDKENAAFISEIVVHRDYTKQGIGKKLMQAVIDELKNQHIARVYAERHPKNPGSTALAKQMGFETFDEYFDPLKRRPDNSQYTTVLLLNLEKK